MKSKLFVITLSFTYNPQFANAKTPVWATLPIPDSSPATTSCAGCLLSGGVWTTATMN